MEGARESQEAMVPVHWDPTGFNLSFISTVSSLSLSWILTTVCIHTLIRCYSKMVSFLSSAMFMLGLIRTKSILLIPKEEGMRQKFPLIPIPLAREWIAFERLRFTYLPPSLILPRLFPSPSPFPSLLYQHVSHPIDWKRSYSQQLNFWYFQQLNFWYFWSFLNLSFQPTQSVSHSV